MRDLGSRAARRKGSSPFPRTSLLEAQALFAGPVPAVPKSGRGTFPGAGRLVETVRTMRGRVL